jgi:hypothetical protein
MKHGKPLNLMGNHFYRQKMTSEEELIKFILDGWNFRKKKTKERLYITRRKSQVERGIGPYSEETWNLIKSLENRKKELKEDREHEQIETIEKEEAEKIDELIERERTIILDIMRSIALWRGIIQLAYCKHRKNGYCHYWNWESKPHGYDYLKSEYGDRIPNIKKMMLESHGKKKEKWIVQAIGIFCANCTGFKPLDQNSMF